MKSFFQLSDNKKFLVILTKKTPDSLDETEFTALRAKENADAHDNGEKCKPTEEITKTTSKKLQIPKIIKTIWTLIYRK